MECVQVKIFESSFQCPLLTSEGCPEAPVGGHVWCPQGDNMSLNALQGLSCIMSDGSQWDFQKPEEPLQASMGQHLPLPH